MIYQLPNGKIIRISVEEFLEITDEDITYLISLDFGESSLNPWTGSVLPHNTKSREIEDFESDDDLSPGNTYIDEDDYLDIPDGFDTD